MEPVFDVQFARNGEPMTSVRCSNCGAVAEYELTALHVGADITCAGCGRKMLVTPHDWELINESVRDARRRWNQRVMGASDG